MCICVIVYVRRDCVDTCRLGLPSRRLSFWPFNQTIPFYFSIGTFSKGIGNLIEIACIVSGKLPEYCPSNHIGKLYPHTEMRGSYEYTFNKIWVRRKVHF